MMRYLPCLTTFTFLFCASISAHAAWIDTKVNGELLYDIFKKENVPEFALQRTFEFLDLNQGKTINVHANSKLVQRTIDKKKFAVIIDYSRPSSERRLFLLNLTNGVVKKYFVAHGVNTGLNDAMEFSNKPNSKQTSLGFYLTGSQYVGSHGDSLYLYGLEKSNDRAFERDIVWHGAPYVSMDFLKKYDRMGRSWGCLAVSYEVNQLLIPILADGTVIYAYHKSLMAMAQTSPAIQSVSNNQETASTQGQDVVPEEATP